ncbi:MAG: ABC transporter permease [Deinococcales bacterium]
MTNTRLVYNRSSRASIPAALVAVGVLFLPFVRPDRAFELLNAELLALRQAPWLALLLLISSGVLTVLALLRLPMVARGYSLIGISLGTLVTLFSWLASTGSNFGLGALCALVCLVLVLGVGLSETGLVQADPFIASSILLCGLFVALFIAFPLVVVLRESVIVEGQLTFKKVVSTLSSPLFMVLENKFTPRSETAIIFGITVFGAFVGLGLGFWRKLKMFALFAALCAGAIVSFIVAAGVLGRGAFATSLYLALIVAPTAVFFGLIFAILEQRCRAAWVRGILSIVGILPMITPPFVLAFALENWFGSQGLITNSIFGIDTNYFKGVTGVAIAQILAFTPVAYLTLRGSVQGLNPALEEAAQTMRSSPWVVFRKITLPLLRPGLAAAFLLTIIESLADFANPILLGGDRSFLATEVYLALTGRFDPHEASVYGGVLLILVLIILGLQRVWLGSTSFVTVTGKPGSGNFSLLPRWLENTLQGVLGFWGLLVALLYGSVFYGSFVKIWGVNNEFTLQHYIDFSGTGLEVLGRTAQVAAVSAVLATLLGFLIAYLVTRQHFFGKNALETTSMLSFATPGTVMGVAYVIAFNVGPWLLTGTFAVLVLALIFRNMPASIRSVIAGLSQIDKALDEASTLLRAPSSTTLARVLLPLLIPQLLSGIVFAFVRGMTAISQIIFLVSPGNLLATVLMLSWLEQGNLGRAAAMSTVMILGLLGLILLLIAFSKRFSRNGTGLEGIG